MSEENPPCLYVNVTVNDGSEIVKAKVVRKIKKGNLPEELKNSLATNVANILVGWVAKEDFARMMSRKLCKGLPMAMESKGLTVETQEVFREGPFFVLELYIKQVDLVKAGEATREGEADLTRDDDAVGLTSRLLDWTLSMIGADRRKNLEEHVLPRVIHDMVLQEMTSIMGTTFSEYQLDADLKILRETEQSRYFFSHLRDVRKSWDNNKGSNNVLDQWRRKVQDDFDEWGSDDESMFET
mmetsp:Transcript_127928/g.370222  ORF Transcript_127928/g.370222 Transcript_127928/m.370222 type:complete len:241 (+) Transcript_127928:52-774(+)